MRRRSVTDIYNTYIYTYIYTHRESLVRNHEPRAKALGNNIIVVFKDNDDDDNNCYHLWLHVRVQVFRVQEYREVVVGRV